MQKLLPNVILEGIGGSGKTTFSNFIQEFYLDMDNTFILHHFYYPEGHSNIEKYGYQHGQFDLMFDMIKKINEKNISFILDRSWLGEYVWSPIYRSITPAYLDALEDEYKDLNNIIINVYADPSIILKRLLERKPNIADDDPYFKQYDEPLDAVKDIIFKFKTIIENRKDYNIKSFNIDASGEFDDNMKNKIVNLLIGDDV